MPNSPIFRKEILEEMYLDFLHRPDDSCQQIIGALLRDLKVKLFFSNIKKATLPMELRESCKKFLFGNQTSSCNLDQSFSEKEFQVKDKFYDHYEHQSDSFQGTDESQRSSLENL